MSELRCGAENCVYNHGRLCGKGEICVGGKHAGRCGDTCCESFAWRREGMDSFTSSINHPSMTISIDCEAVKCIYNTEYKCTAKHVDINGIAATGSGETSCGTFREK